MDPREIEQMIKGGLDEAQVQVHGDGRHFQAVVVSPAFAGKTPIQRHRMVYSLLEQHIHAETLHAISMRTLTPEQWAAEQS